MATIQIGNHRHCRSRNIFEQDRLFACFLDRLGDGCKLVLGLDFSQPSLNAQLTTTAMREWTGLLAYYVSGRTHALFPK